MSHTYPEHIEPGRIGFIHNLGPLDDAYDEDAPHKPPDIIGNLSSKMPPKVLAYPFPP